MAGFRDSLSAVRCAAHEIAQVELPNNLPRRPHFLLIIDMLEDVALFLAAAVLFVPLFKRLKLGAVLGYLAAGLVIGPHGLGFANDAEKVLQLSEFGVVLLLFVIGLELQASRLWHLRHEVFAAGSAQVLSTALLLAPLAHYLGLAWPAAIAVGLALAMSSTALALQMLAERNELTHKHGRAAFAILLFQDLSVIPLLAMIPLLAPEVGMARTWADGGKALTAVVVVILAGRTVLRPVLRLVASIGVPEVFTAAALLVVIGVSLAMQAVGLSMSLGAFLAGMLLADSEYRHELQADIEPFKGLLLGLFFMAVGMGADLGLVLHRPLAVLGISFGLIAIKLATGYVVGRGTGESHQTATKLAATLAQGGEFAFVLFALMLATRLVPADTLALLTVAVTISMMLSPLIYAFTGRHREDVPAPFDEINTAETPVVIAGFGPFGQIIGRVLRLKKVPFTVLDKNAQHVDFVRSFGNPVFYSDASRPEVLRASHVHQAKLFVIAISEEVESVRVLQAVRAFAPALRVMAVARTRQHALNLMELGVQPDDLIRRSYYSSLQMTQRVMLALGFSEAMAQRTVDTFRQKDEETLLRQQAHPHDEVKLRQTAEEFARELEQLFEADQDAEDKK